MTLLLTAMNTAAIHQSSDYRLTDLSTGKPVEDSAGAKQVSFGGMDFAAQISFTGVASVGGVGIRDLISKVVAPVTRASELQAVVGRSGPVLGPLVPVLEERLGAFSVAPRLTPEEERVRLFEAIAGLLAR